MQKQGLRGRGGAGPGSWRKGQCAGGGLGKRGGARAVQGAAWHRGRAHISGVCGPPLLGRFCHSYLGEEFHLFELHQGLCSSTLLLALGCTLKVVNHDHGPFIV